MDDSTREHSTHTIDSEPVDISATPLSLARAVLARRSEYVRPEKIRVKVGTWNVAACPGTDKDLASWFVGGKGIIKGMAGLDLSSNPAVEYARSSKSNSDSDSAVLIGGEKIDLYVLGLQEVVDFNMKKDYMMRAVYSDTGPVDKWTAAMEAALPKGYKLIMAEQMAGLLLMIYASPDLAPSISNISTHQVGTGLFGYLGNKGAVVTRLVLGEATRMVFVNCHLASGAGQSYLDRRCWDVEQIVAKTQFEPVATGGVVEDEGNKIGNEDYAFWLGDLNFRLEGLPGDDIRRILTLHARGEYDVSGTKAPAPLEGGGVIVMRASESDDEATTISSMHSREESFDSVSSLPDPDDFPEDPSQDPASLQSTIDSLLPHDQLRRIITQRKLFHDGWREGPISFLPTYKYDVGTVGLFDSSEKQRAPSWCDRILYRTKKDKSDYDQKVQEEIESRKKDEEMKSRGLEEDDDVLFSYDPDTDGDEHSGSSTNFDYDEYDEGEGGENEDTSLTKDDIADPMSLDVYTSHQRITSSDHKPVSSVFTLAYDAVDLDLRAQVHTEVARELDRAENEGRPGITLVVEGDKGQPDGSIDFGDVAFFNRYTCSLTIANTGGVAATFEFLNSLTPDEDGGGSTPKWLKTSFHRSDEGEKGEKLGLSVTLEPGDTITAIIAAQITEISHVRALNDSRGQLDEVLVLRVEEGKDHFISVHGTWLPSCFGRSVDELIRIPESGIRQFALDKNIKGAIPYDSDVHCSAPRELFKLTEAIQALAERCVADAAMLADMTLPKDPGWPFDPAARTIDKIKEEALTSTLVAALDTNVSIHEALPVELRSLQKLEVVSSVLLLFLSSLTDGLISSQLWAKLSTLLPQNLTSLPTTAWSDAKQRVLDILSVSPSHNIAFVFLTATLARVATELNPVTPQSPVKQTLSRRLSFRPGAVLSGESESMRKRRAMERRYAEIVGPLTFRTGADDKATKERERVIVEMFLRREDEDS